MKRLALLVCFAAMASGCATAQVQQMLTNLDRDCIRHYAGSFGSGAPVAQATITFQIDCQPHPATVAPTTTP